MGTSTEQQLVSQRKRRAQEDESGGSRAGAKIDDSAMDSEPG